MSDLNNDNIWEYTVSLPVGSYEYKYSADNWLIQKIYQMLEVVLLLLGDILIEY